MTSSKQRSRRERPSQQGRRAGPGNSSLIPHPSSLSAPPPKPVWPSARQLSRQQADWVRRWHEAEALPLPEAGAAPEEPFANLVREQHRRNFLLWHEEDKARDRCASDAVIAGVKRRIDKLNQERNDLMEELNVALRRMLRRARVRVRPGALWNTETPGSAIDRLSVLNLKVFHMELAARECGRARGFRRECLEKLRILTRQRRELVCALGALLKAIRSGQRRLKMYRQMKTYNDRRFNPYLARRKR